MSILEVLPESPVVELRRDTPAVARALSGTTIRFQTTDAAYREALARGLPTDRAGFVRLNALTGPVAIDGAEPGDAVRIRVLAIEPGPTAFAVYIERWAREAFDLDASWIEAYPIEQGWVRLGRGRSVPCRPMIGCIATAPARGRLSALSPTGATGGNLDWRELEPGATIWLPVQVPGGLLALGDVHAAMGAGEPASAGLECAGAVTVRVDVAHGVELEGPRLETDARVAFLGSHPSDPFVAKTRAIRAARRALIERSGADAREAFALCSALLHLSLGGPAGANVVAWFDRDDWDGFAPAVPRPASGADVEG